MIEISSAPTLDDSYRVPALEKGLDVLEHLASSSDAFTLKELSEQLQRTSQELFRVVNTLVLRGYLLRDAAGRYRTSMKLFEMGNRHAATQALIARAMPHMERLAETIGESCHLSIVVQDRMLVVARAECAADVKISVRVGATYDMHLRVSGRVALAWMSPERRADYWKRHSECEGGGNAIESELTRIREQGFEATDSPIIVGGQDFAAPVVSGGEVLAVLCMSRLSRVGETSQRSEFAAAVARSAASISAEFGSPGAGLVSMSSPEEAEKRSRRKSTAR